MSKQWSRSLRAASLSVLPRFCVFAGALLAGPPAFAHAYLAHASPPAGGTVRSTPQDLDLFFTEAVVPHFSSVELRDATGQKLHTGALHAKQGGRELVVPLPKLAPGKYTVTWQVTSEDTHKTQGTFTFTLTP